MAESYLKRQMIVQFFTNRSSYAKSFLAVAGLCAAPWLPAATVIATNNSTTPSTTVQRRISDAGDTGFVNLTVGQFQMTRTGGTATEQILAGPSGGATFVGFCAEPKESLGSSVTYTLSTVESGSTLTGGMGTEKANLVRELIGRHYPDYTSTLTAQTAGALQVALWEIVRETETASGGSLLLSTSTGNVTFGTSATTGLVALAQSYLSSLTGSPTAPRANNLRVLTVTGNQDVLVMLAAAPVPEPATAAAGLGALALVVAAYRRRSRRS